MRRQLKPAYWRGFAWASGALAVAVRAVFLLVLPVADNGNSSYTIPAYGLVATGTYSELHRLPGAPLFFALCYVVVGRRDVLLVAAQHLLGLGTLALIVSFARRAWGPRAAALAAILAAAQLWLPFQECYLLSETLAEFLLAASLWSILRLRRGPAVANFTWALAGALAGTAGLTRGELLALGPISTFALAWPFHERRRGPAIFLAAWMAVIGGWVARNEVRFGFDGLTPDVPAIFLKTAQPLVRFDLPTYPEGKRRLREAETAQSLQDSESVADQLLERESGYSYLSSSRELGRITREAIMTRPLAYAPLYLRALAEQVLPYSWIDEGAVGNGIPALRSGPESPRSAFWTFLRLDQWIGWLILLLAGSVAIFWRKASQEDRRPIILLASSFAILALEMAPAASAAREQAELQLLLIPIAAFAADHWLGACPDKERALLK